MHMNMQIEPNTLLLISASLGMVVVCVVDSVQKRRNFLRNGSAK